MLEHVQRLSQAPPERGLHLYEEKFAGPPRFVAYREFPGRVAACAAFFRDQGVRAGTRVLFPFETSPEAIFSFLALLEIGAVPLSVKPLLMATPRQAYEDFLTRVASEFRADRVLRVPGVDGISVPADPLPLPRPGRCRPGARLRMPGDEELAFVQFTSGATAFPKGVPVRHGNLRLNLSMITRTDGGQPDERGSSWLPLYHDMGLVGGLLSCLVRAGDLLLAKPETFLADPCGWWQHMADQRVSGSVIPNFAIDYSLKLMSHLTRDQIAEMDLSRLRGIYLGSEPVNIANLQAFLDLMAPAGLRRDVFMPCYGMAEAVLLVSSCPPGSPLRVVPSPSGVPAISCGKPMPEFTVRLRGEDGNLCGDNELGEIELAGGSLASAYFNTAAPLAAGDGFYRTGDIGFTSDGDLFITGRISDRIKVNGRSFFAADFEQALEKIPFVREGRAAVIQHNGRIVVLAEVDRTARQDVDGSRARITGHLMSAIGVTVLASDVHFPHPGQLKRTSSGKLQRKAIAEAYAKGQIRGLTLGSR